MAWTMVLALAAALTGQSTSAQPPAPAAKAESAAKQAEAKTASAKPASARPAAKGSPRAAKAAAKPSVKPADPAPVRVLTKEEMDRRRSSFLLPPGGQAADRYGEAIDWNEIPPWRQTSFFGLRARGQFFIYIIDGSGSMIDDNRFPRATIELRRSVMALRPPQKFEVIFFNEESIPMPGGPIPRSADLESKNLLRSWLRLMDPGGGTDPLAAIKQALALRPDAVFLLSDGALPEGTVGAVGRANTHKIPIHCVDLAGGLGGDQLKQIATASGGNHASRAGPSAERP